MQLRKVSRLNEVMYFVPGREAQLVARLTRESEAPGSIRFGHVLPFLFPLIQEGQLPGLGERICMMVRKFKPASVN